MDAALFNRQRTKILQLEEENEKLRDALRKLTPPDPSTAILAMMLGSRSEMPERP